MVDRDSASDHSSSSVVHAPLMVPLGQAGCTPVCIGPEGKPSGLSFVRPNHSGGVVAKGLMHWGLVMPKGKGLS